MSEANPIEPSGDRLEREDFEHLIGEPLDDVDQLEPGFFCRARRVDRDVEPLAFAGYCLQRAGFKTEHVGEGRCHLHGGRSPRAEDSPHFEHGLFSDYLGEKDKETLEILGGFSNAEKLQEAIDWRLARLRRALRQEDDSSEETGDFWDAVDSVITEASASPDGLEPAHIQQLGKLVDNKQRAAQDELDLIRRLVLAHSKITEGETLNVNNDMSFDGDASLSVEWETVDEDALDVDEE